METIGLRSISIRFKVTAVKPAMHRTVALVTTLASVGATGALHAQYRCDCTSVVATCSAEVNARSTYLEIKTNQQTCVRVDYFVDGQPFVSLVVDGEDRQTWLPRTASPKIMVQSCQVCRDNGASATPQRAGTAQQPAPAQTNGENGAAAVPQPLIESIPEYPPAAAARGATGFVEVEFTIAPSGAVEQPRIVAAEPSGLFEAAALAAVGRRRYAEDQASGSRVLRERIEFGPQRGTVAPRAPLPPASGQRNRCVREDAVYNYGESVDVSFINACSEPLMVFACALGTGKSAGRWNCVDSEQRGDLLAPANDARLGTRRTLNGNRDLRTYTYRNSFSLTRAPNSAYWWVACVEVDSVCRDDARQWTRAVTGQPPNIDPAARSPIAVDRSF
jgi:TonB family protein